MNKRWLSYAMMHAVAGAVLLLPAPVAGDFDGISASLVAQPTIDGIEWDVWRVYVEVTNSLDQVTFCSGNDENPLMIAADGPNGFYQNETFGENDTEPIMRLLGYDADLAHDSFVTIGAELLNGEVATQTQNFSSPGWRCTRLILRNGAWFRTPDQPPTVAGKSLRVLIGQFTIDRGATLSGKLRVAGVFDGDSSNYYVVDLPNALCDADIDRDGVAAIDDFVELIIAWGDCPDICDCPADINQDGAVDVDDILQLIADWGMCP